MGSTHVVWSAIAIILFLLFMLWVYILVSNKRANSVRKRTNERLAAVEASNHDHSKTQGVVMSIQSDVHMIKQYLMEKGQK